MKINLLKSIVLMLIISCTKPSNEIKPEIRRKTLSRITTTQINTEKTFRVQEWKYDNADRCIELIEKGIFPMNGIDTMLITARYTFFYINAQKEPFRIVQDGNSENISSNVYINYSSDGKKIQDSTIYTHPSLGKLLRVANYRYENGIVYYDYHESNITWTGLLDGIPGKKQDSVYITAGNVKEYRIKLSTTSNEVVKRIYTYDDKTNPFAQMNITSAFYEIGPNFNYRKWFALYSENDDLSIIGYNKNNITKTQNTASPQSTREFSYVYDQDGYPTEATISLMNASGNAKIKFEYNE